MPILTNPQLEGLASNNLGAGVELNPNWDEPFPDAPCWGWALFGGPGGDGNNTPPVIFERALKLNEHGVVIGVKPDFADWVRATFPDNEVAANQADIIIDNFDEAWVEPDLQIVCREAFARLCISVSGLIDAAGASNYCIVMASDHWYTWEHWALGLANNINAPANPETQYTQRDAGINPVNTRCRNVWGEHPLLTQIPIVELHQGHIDYLQHAAGFPSV
ncbi:MAG TPA: hypothetical protein VIF37_13975 [Methylobacter sp.]|jgi:hypothetical protein